MERLENLVREMESGQLPLEKLISSYEEGVKLASQCQEKLDAAAKKIQIIQKFLWTNRFGGLSSCCR